MKGKKLEQYSKDCQYIENIGYRMVNFPFATGGGEDEDDCYLYVKGNTALERDYTTGIWSKHNFDELTYSNFIYKTGEIINIYTLL